MLGSSSGIDCNGRADTATAFIRQDVSRPYDIYQLWPTSGGRAGHKWPPVCSTL